MDYGEKKKGHVSPYIPFHNSSSLGIKIVAQFYVNYNQSQML